MKMLIFAIVLNLSVAALNTAIWVYTGSPIDAACAVFSACVTAALLGVAVAQ